LVARRLIEAVPPTPFLLFRQPRELIALAVSVTTRCDGCITVHTNEAIEHGATKAEISEALGVAVALNARSAMVYSARVMDAYAAHSST
jgi:AhpD family alkylhydroperoxidase